MIVVSVLKQGKGYGAENARMLHYHMGDYENVCLTDIPSIDGVDTLKMETPWEGWWSKLNLFNPDHPLIGDQDIFYLDIDSVICGDITPLFNQKTFTALTDFYQEGNPHPPMASGVMYIPVEQKELVWNEWHGHETKIMAENHPMPHHGDQGFIARCFEKNRKKVDRWQDVAPNKVISFKKDVAKEGDPGFHNRRSKGNGLIPEEAVILCFHGKPRPWDIDVNKLLRESGR